MQTVRQRRIINRALTRPETVAGAEKTPLGVVVGLVVLFGLMGWTFASIPAAVAAALAAFVGIPVVRRMAKADPMLVAVYLANLKYHAHYPARTPGHVVVAAAKRSNPLVAHATTAGLCLLPLGWWFSSPAMLLAGVGCVALAVLMQMRSSRSGAA